MLMPRRDPGTFRAHRAAISSETMRITEISAAGQMVGVVRSPLSVTRLHRTRPTGRVCRNYPPEPYHLGDLACNRLIYSSRHGVPGHWSQGSTRLKTGLQVESDAFQQLRIFVGQADNPVTSIAGQSSQAILTRPFGTARTPAPMFMVYMHLAEIAGQNGLT